VLFFRPVLDAPLAFERTPFAFIAFSLFPKVLLVLLIFQRPHFLVVLWPIFVCPGNFVPMSFAKALGSALCVLPYVTTPFSLSSPRDFSSPLLLFLLVVSYILLVTSPLSSVTCSTNYTLSFGHQFPEFQSFVFARPPPTIST